MDYFSKQYTLNFKEILMPHGFKNYKRKAFYLIENDIIKTISYNRFFPMYDICFDILPLCSGIDEYALINSDRFSLNHVAGKQWDSWMIINNTPEIVVKVIADMIDSAKHYIMPFFNRIHDCKDAYSEIGDLEKRLYTGINGGIILHDFTKVCMCLKNKDYINASKHMEAIIKQNEDAIAINSAEREKQGAFEEANAYKAKKIAELAQKKEFYRHISIPDIEFKNAFLKANELKLKKFLKIHY